MAIMTSAEWIKDTSRTMYSRSPELKALDQALYTYHHMGQKVGDLKALRTAFDTWAGGKTNNGQNSRRNHRNAVAHLDDEINAELRANAPSGLPKGGIALMGLSVGQGALHAHAAAPSATRTTVTMTDDAQVSSFSTAVLALWSAPVWNAKTKKQRGDAVIAAVASVHTACGIPNVTPDVKVLPPGYGGFFNFQDWSIQLSEGLFDFACNPGNRTKLVDVAETVYHEARHCEQWFHMARYYALGRTANDIKTNLYINKQAICDEAKRRQMKADDKMSALTKDWFDSVYGADSSRGITLGALALKRRAAAIDTTDLHTRLHEKYKGGLAEEVDAWAIQLLVRAKF